LISKKSFCHPRARGVFARLTPIKNHHINEDAHIASRALHRARDEVKHANGRAIFFRGFRRGVDDIFGVKRRPAAGCFRARFLRRASYANPVFMRLS